MSLVTHGTQLSVVALLGDQNHLPTRLSGSRVTPVSECSVPLPAGAPELDPVQVQCDLLHLLITALVRHTPGEVGHAVRDPGGLGRLLRTIATCFALISNTQ